MLNWLANPARFERFARRVEPVAATVSLVLFPMALYWSLVVSPAAEDHGDTVRILYVHVASAWAMMACYTSLAIASFVYFVWRHPLADVGARAVAVVGSVMTVLCLATGSLWGKPAWNTWWQWDGRMTSVFLLLCLYVAYFAVRRLERDRVKSARLAAVIAMVGAINLPVIKFSVDWWATLHQPATLSSPGAPGLPSPLLVPLLLMVSAYTAFIIWFVTREMRSTIRHAGNQRRSAPLPTVTISEL